MHFLSYRSYQTRSSPSYCLAYGLESVFRAHLASDAFAVRIEDDGLNKPARRGIVIYGPRMTLSVCVLHFDSFTPR